MDGAHGVLLSIAGGSDLGLFEINEAASLVQEAAHEDANIIFGTVIDDSLGDEVQGDRHRRRVRLHAADRRRRTIGRTAPHRGRGGRPARRWVLASRTVPSPAIRRLEPREHSRRVATPSRPATNSQRRLRTYPAHRGRRAAGERQRQRSPVSSPAVRARPIDDDDDVDVPPVHEAVKIGRQESEIRSAGARTPRRCSPVGVGRPAPAGPGPLTIRVQPGVQHR